MAARTPKTYAALVRFDLNGSTASKLHRSSCYTSKAAYAEDLRLNGFRVVWVWSAEQLEDVALGQCVGMSVREAAAAEEVSANYTAAEILGDEQLPSLCCEAEAVMEECEADALAKTERIIRTAKRLTLEELEAAALRAASKETAALEAANEVERLHYQHVTRAASVAYGVVRSALKDADLDRSIPDALEVLDELRKSERALQYSAEVGCSVASLHASASEAYAYAARMLEEHFCSLESVQDEDDDFDAELEATTCPHCGALLSECGVLQVRYTRLELSEGSRTLVRCNEDEPVQVCGECREELDLYSMGLSF